MQSNFRSAMLGFAVGLVVATAGAQAAAQAQAVTALADAEAMKSHNGAAPANVQVTDHAAGNGAVPVKKRGGWPAGKPRKAKAAQVVAQ